MLFLKSQHFGERGSAAERTGTSRLALTQRGRSGGRAQAVTGGPSRGALCMGVCVRADMGRALGTKFHPGLRATRLASAC